MPRATSMAMNLDFLSCSGESVDADEGGEPIVFMGAVPVGSKVGCGVAIVRSVVAAAAATAVAVAAMAEGVPVTIVS